MYDLQTNQIITSVDFSDFYIRIVYYAVHSDSWIIVYNMSHVAKSDSDLWITN